MSYPDLMDHIEVLREKIGRLRDEIAHLVELNAEYRRTGSQGRNEIQAQIAHGQRQERLQAIQQELALAATIKLPNDVCVEGKKVAGMLVEMRAQEHAPHFAIAGIGINVNQTPEDFSEELRPHAISLAIALSRQVDRQKFAAALLHNLDRTYREIFASHEGGSSSLHGTP